jgi:hypothetical protein
MDFDSGEDELVETSPGIRGVRSFGDEESIRGRRRPLRSGFSFDGSKVDEEISIGKRAKQDLAHSLARAPPVRPVVGRIVQPDDSEGDVAFPCSLEKQSSAPSSRPGRHHIERGWRDSLLLPPSPQGFCRSKGSVLLKAREEDRVDLLPWNPMMFKNFSNIIVTFCVGLNHAGSVDTANYPSFPIMAAPEFVGCQRKYLNRHASIHDHDRCRYPLGARKKLVKIGKSIAEKSDPQSDCQAEPLYGKGPTLTPHEAGSQYAIFCRPNK